ncbi:formylglycine-generating enzyme family protein [Labilibaculum sp. DW002]|uniref:Formylglycine-generating enzyme family protein n=1 Tax=Paralabilibaculum antarcticum TaxID=2912572 RepID=A0ABT5VVB2_9BACT|nr:formylglycine-generating enzyme family protein [Labilibaculum sp. DW002]MDE5419205.1 formylglycine-generating enzyme family protein [Labilibaculum sp. DW002]
MKLKHLFLQLSLLLALFACSKEEDESYHQPEITTSGISIITNTRATCGGNLTSNGHMQITAKGLVWHTSANVSLDVNTGKTVDENKAGKFVSTLLNLKKNTSYYVRAYATNDLGTTYGEEREFTTANGMDMISVQGGNFQMGSNNGDPDEKPIHSVTISSFEIGKYEVMQAQWTAVMDNNPSHFKGDSLPVEQVDWNEIQTFINKLNEQTGLNYRLPTEAEWEFASRGGNLTHSYTYSGSNTLDDVAWYINNSGNKTHKVGSKQANELGIYDMSGNVWEWCSDIYGSYSSNSQTNPQGSSSGSYLDNRGGGWFSGENRCPVSNRSNCYPSSNYDSLGFRLVLSL